MRQQKERVRSAFASAEGYDAEAHIQQAVAQELAQYISTLALPADPVVWEIGCGSGFLTEALLPLVPGGDWRITDIAPAMVARAQAKLGSDPRLHFAVEDGEESTTEHRFDLICSSLALQWFQDLPGGISRLTDRLRPGGQLAFTTLVAGSFAEWEAAHRAVGLVAATPSYPTGAQIEDYCPSDCHSAVHVAPHVQQHADGRAFLMALKAIGANIPRDAKAPLGVADLRRVLAAFDAGAAQISYQVATVVFTKGA